MAAARKTCANGCGFFGDAATRDMCSKCFRECTAKGMFAPVAVAAAAATAAAPLPVAVAASPAAVGRGGGGGGGDGDVVMSCAATPPPAAGGGGGGDACMLAVTPDVAASASKGRARCFTCNKKVGLTGFECRCKRLFCAEHRYSDTHECDFDFKTSEREHLTKLNPRVAGMKVDKL